MENGIKATAPARRSLVWWVGIAAAMGMIVTLFLFDPVRHGFYPPCWFHRLTGWNCPACGCLRATHALLHGHLAAALHNNPLFVVSLPLLAAWLLARYFRSKDRLPAEGRTTRTVWPWIGVGILVLFGIARNLPWPVFRWMSP